VILQVMTSIDRTEWGFGHYFYLQLPDTVKYILNDVFICSIEEQFIDRGESE